MQAGQSGPDRKYVRTQSMVETLERVFQGYSNAHRQSKANCGWAILCERTGGKLAAAG